MPEEVKTTSTTSATELPQPDFSLAGASDTALLRPLIQISIGGGIIAIGLYLVLALQTGAWQLLAEAGLIVVGITFGLLASRLIKQGRFHAAGYSLIFGFAIAYGGAEAILIGFTSQIVIGGSLLIILTGSILLPGQWKKILSIGILYVASIWVISHLTFLPRYDASHLVILNLVITGITVATGLAVFWRFMRTYPSYTLRSKLTIAFLAVSLVSVGLVTFYADRTLRTTLQERASSQLTNVAQLRGTAVGDLLAGEVKLLQTLALSEKIRSEAETSNASYLGNEADSQAALSKLDETWRAAVDANNDREPLVKAKLGNPIAHYLQEYRALYPENVEIFATDLRGALLGATNRTSDYYQADEDWWQAAYSKGAGAIYYSQPVYDESSGTFSINIALPVYAQSGTKMVGILRTTVDLAAKTESIANAQLGEINLLLPNGSRVTGQGPASMPNDLLAQLPVNAETTTEVEWEGQPSFAAVAPVRASDSKLGISVGQLRWKVIAHQPRAEILAPVEAQTATVLLVFAVIAVIIVGTSIGLSQILVRPITNLTTTAKRVSEGDLAARAAIETNDEIGTLALTFNSMTAQLSNLVSSLEERVQARTEQLQTSAAVGQAAASVLDPDQLLREVVNLITDRFGFYYAAVFTLDDVGRYAVLRAGTGEAGRILTERDHKLEVGGQSMVGSVTAQHKARIALDVGAEAMRFANPLLPDTRSEIALPLMVGNRVLGALDVQSTREAAFDDASATVLQSMADQIAIALNNAEQFKLIELQAKQQSNLNEFSRSLFAASRMEELYGVLATTLNSIVPHDYLSLTFTQSGSATLREYPLKPDSDPVLTEGPVWSTPNAMSGQACATRQPRVSAHLEQDVTLDDAAQWVRAGFHSALSLPLIVGERVLGTLNFASVQPQAYVLENAPQLEQLAGQVAVALENRRLAQAQQKSLQDMERLTRQLTGQSWAARRQRQTMESAQYIRSGIKADRPTSTPELEAAFEQGAPIARSEPAGPDTPSFYQAALAVPIMLRGEVLGGLQVGEARQARVWTEEDLSFMQAVADQVALALDNARLIEETERRAERERLVADISSRMFAANDLETIVQIAGQELGRILQVKQTTIKVRSELAETIAQPGNGHTPDQYE